MSRRILLVGALGVLALLSPAWASAVRYANPSGTPGDNCQSVATACDFVTAVRGTGGNVPATGEEVIIEPGTYAVNEFMAPAVVSNLNIHGVFDQQRPVIEENGHQFQVGHGSDVSYLTIEASDSGKFAFYGSGVAERLLVETKANGNGPSCECDGDIRDSVFVSTGTGPALGMESGGGTVSATYRNVTAYTLNAAAPAIQLYQGGVGGLTINAYNVIADNSAGGHDVVANGPLTSITLSHSNYDNPAQFGGGVVVDANDGPHQATPPLFVDPSGGNFGEAPDSPTVDAGLSDPLSGSMDFAGNARVLGASTDIGAEEFVPRPAPVVERPSNAFSIGKLKSNTKNGSAISPVFVAGPGAVTALATNTVVAGSSSSAPSRAKRPALIKPRTVSAVASGKVLVHLVPTRVARKILKRKGKLAVNVTITFMPTGGLAASQSFKPYLKLALKRPHT